MVKTKGHQVLNGDTRAREHVAARDKLWGQVEGPSGQRLCVGLVGHWYYFLTATTVQVSAKRQRQRWQARCRACKIIVDRNRTRAGVDARSFFFFQLSVYVGCNLAQCYVCEMGCSRGPVVKFVLTASSWCSKSGWEVEGRGLLTKARRKGHRDDRSRQVVAGWGIGIGIGP